MRILTGRRLQRLPINSTNMDNPMLNTSYTLKLAQHVEEEIIKHKNTEIRRMMFDFVYCWLFVVVF